MKKSHQKKKATMQEKKLREKLKKAGPNGKLDARSTMKFVEKAVKTGQVKLVSKLHMNSKHMKYDLAQENEE